MVIAFIEIGNSCETVGLFGLNGKSWGRLWDITEFDWLISLWAMPNKKLNVDPDFVCGLEIISEEPPAYKR